MALFTWQNFRSGGTRLSAENLNAAQQALLEEAQDYADTVVGGGGGGPETDPIATAAIAAHDAETTNVHGIADTTTLATDAEVAAAVAAEALARDAADTALDGRLDTLEAVDNATQTELDAEATTRANADTALDGRLDTVETTLPTKADLVGGKVPSSQIPAVALVQVFTVASQAAQLALTAQEGDVAVRTDEHKTYMHNGGSAGSMADWTLLDTPTDAVTSVNGQTGTVTLAKGDVGLGNVDNTSDANKPVSTAQQTALDAKAPLASPTFTGDPKAPTPAQGDNDTSVATTAYVQTEAGLLVPKSLVDAKGDLLVGSADNTVIRKAVGANDTVLTADTSQSGGVKWATPADPPVLLPAHYGLLGMAYDPALTGAALALQAGVINFVKLYVPSTITITNAVTYIWTAGTGATALANCYAGIYSSALARLGTSANQASAWATTGTKTMALTEESAGSLTIAGGSGVFIYVALLVGTQSTTAVQVARSSVNNVNIVNLGLASGSYRFGRDNGSGFTSLAAAPSNNGSVNSAAWAGVS